MRRSMLWRERMQITIMCDARRCGASVCKSQSNVSSLDPIYGFFHGVYNHVIAIINDDDGGFRVYDNDSPQRQRGTYQNMRADEVTGIPGNMMTLVAITRMGTDISDRMGGAILTLKPTRKRGRDRRASAR